MCQAAPEVLSQHHHYYVPDCTWSFIKTSSLLCARLHLKFYQSIIITMCQAAPEVLSQHHHYYVPGCTWSFHHSIIITTCQAAPEVFTTASSLLFVKMHLKVYHGLLLPSSPFIGSFSDSNIIAILSGCTWSFHHSIIITIHQDAPEDVSQHYCNHHVSCIWSFYHSNIIAILLGCTWSFLMAFSSLLFLKY